MTPFLYMRLLKRHWWMIAARGALAVLLGFVFFGWPAETSAVLLIVLSVFMVTDGALCLAAVSFPRPREHALWTFRAEAYLSIAFAGAIAFFSQLAPLPGFVLLALWSAGRGLLAYLGARRLRGERHVEVPLAMESLISVTLAVLLLFKPGMDEIVIHGILGLYAVSHGVSLVLLSLRLRTVEMRARLIAV